MQTMARFIFESKDKYWSGLYLRQMLNIGPYKNLFEKKKQRCHILPLFHYLKRRHFQAIRCLDRTIDYGNIMSDIGR